MGARVRLINGKVVADQFPKSNIPNTGVVTSTPIRFGITDKGGPLRRGSAPGVLGRIADTPDFSIDNKIKKGSSFFPSQSPNRSLSSISIGDPSISRKKRAKLSKKDKSKKKSKVKQKPLKSIFDLSF